MKKIKIIIISLIIVVIILAIALGILLNNKEKIENSIEEEKISEEIQTEENNDKEKLENDYVVAKDIMNNYFNTLSQSIEGVNNSVVILSVLDKEYITQNNLTEENVIEKFGQYKEINSYGIRDMFKQKIEKDEQIIGYYIYIKGIIRQNGNTQTVYSLIQEDFQSSSYSICFINADEYDRAKTGEKIRNATEINIEQNDYNMLADKVVSEYEISLEYLRDYINTVYNNINDGYNLLDEEYRNKKFANIEDYKNYIELQNINPEIVVLKEYAINEKDGYTQYVCIDANGRNYIFKVTSIMNYTVLLDTYTIDLPEFISKYNDATEPNKVLLNIQKVFQAINSGDYKYVYEKLDNDFKANYFKTQEDFENYIKQNLYTNNKVSYTTYEQNGEVYIYNIQITDGNGENAGTINKKILMKLQEGTDFVMSFSVE